MHFPQITIAHCEWWTCAWASSPGKPNMAGGGWTVHGVKTIHVPRNDGDEMLAFHRGRRNTALSRKVGATQRVGEPKEWWTGMWAAGYGGEMSCAGWCRAAPARATTRDVVEVQLHFIFKVRKTTTAF